LINLLTFLAGFVNGVFFIIAGILILGVQKLKAYIEQVRFDREQKAYNFRSEGLSRYRLSKFSVM